MIRVLGLRDGIKVHKALGSEVRVDIMELILENEGINLNEIANRLNLTNGALTGHIRKLEDAGLITLSNDGRSNQKIYKVTEERILTEVRSEKVDKNVYQAEVKPGLYTDFEVYPSCGLASPEQIIGDYDDPRYFISPERASAEILWFSKGYVEYILPSIIPKAQKIDEISISAELSSEAPGANDFYPSDIYFSINGVELGYWTSPGDFGNVRGRYTPEWLRIGSNQYGLLKNLVINHEGTFMDFVRMSDVTVDTLKLTSNSTIRFRLTVPEDAEHVGGLTIYGRNFGNFDQDIKVQISYSSL